MIEPLLYIAFVTAAIYFALKKDVITFKADEWPDVPANDDEFRVIEAARLAVSLDGIVAVYDRFQHVPVHPDSGAAWLLDAARLIVQSRNAQTPALLFDRLTKAAALLRECTDIGDDGAYFAEEHWAFAQTAKAWLDLVEAEASRQRYVPRNPIPGFMMVSEFYRRSLLKALDTDDSFERNVRRNIETAPTMEMNWFTRQLSPAGPETALENALFIIPAALREYLACRAEEMEMIEDAIDSNLPVAVRTADLYQGGACAAPAA